MLTAKGCFAAWSLPVWGFIGTVSGVTDAIQALRDMAGTGSAAAAGAKAGMAQIDRVIRRAMGPEGPS